MKRLLSFFAFAAILFLTGCSTFRDEPTLSVWAEGGWLVFWVPFLGSFPFLYMAYKASKSGSEALPNSEGKPVFQSDENIPIYKLGKFWFGVVLQLFAWGVVWYFNSNNWR